MKRLSPFVLFLLVFAFAAGVARTSGSFHENDVSA